MTFKKKKLTSIRKKKSMNFLCNQILMAIGETGASLAEIAASDFTQITGLKNCNLKHFLNSLRQKKIIGFNAQESVYRLTEKGKTYLKIQGEKNDRTN